MTVEDLDPIAADQRELFTAAANGHAGAAAELRRRAASGDPSALFSLEVLGISRA
ncbi:hypothetical protein Back2_14770 [Nocardioides baekrokdamisoli]|uniref:Uncharacterized protein n=1 Tax=Nocardioides baekrokdamisoli TaxID=1804624 RepID=A0A3G9IDZ3_9ACTN|nr:hypothetical protein [Nocardioides baekrokdamisoli]BBH17190.1 hypothetical protein Back2_14770 [Nocardioides baekrokdamisoli]